MVAVCEICKREMAQGGGCVKVPIRHKGMDYDPVPFGQERRYGEVSEMFADAKLDTCPDCAVGLGEYHHPGCDWEECPVCHWQLISCDCMDPIED